jgi:hypothetical protein
MTTTEDESIRFVREANPVRDPAELLDEDPQRAVRIAARAKLGPAREQAQPVISRRLVYALGTVLLTTLVGAVLLSGFDESAPSIVDRAVAATSADSAVFHIVERVRVRRVPEEPTLAGPYRTDTTTIIESWYASDGRAHVREYASTDRGRGALLFEFARDRSSIRTFDPATGRTLEQPNGDVSEVARGEVLEVSRFEDPGTQLRALRNQGQLRASGEAHIDGQPALRLTSSAPPADVPERSDYRVEFLVDAGTFLPLQERRSMQLKIDPEDDRSEHPDQAIGLRRAQQTGRTTVSSEVVRTFLTYEELPLNEQNAEKLQLGIG